MERNTTEHTFGSAGERTVQEELKSTKRADRFYDRQMFDHLPETMQTFIRRQEMVFIATADAKGNCDCSPRFGKPGFIAVLDEKTLAYPEFRGNGVFASMGNIHENPHIGMVFVDFLETTVGLHVNGTARICEGEEIGPELASIEDDYETGALKRLIERWVVIHVEEAYIHCSKHVPHLQKLEKAILWGTDDPTAKSDAFFCGPGSN